MPSLTRIASSCCPPRRSGRAVRIRVCRRLALSTLLAAIAGSALAQQLPVPSAGLPGSVNDAQEIPDPGVVYKVVFDISSAGPADKVHPNLMRAARYLNTLAEYGVPPIRRQLTILVHGSATPCVLRDAGSAERNRGHSNPDAALIAALQQAGVTVRVDGQALLEQRIAARDVLPGVQVDLSAVSTLTNLQLHGYVVIGE
jgi:intracellular sulfur oxidation DsrE/DsrF family protein